MIITSNDKANEHNKLFITSNDKHNLCIISYISISLLT